MPPSNATPNSNQCPRSYGSHNYRPTCTEHLQARPRLNRFVSPMISVTWLTLHRALPLNVVLQEQKVCRTVGTTQQKERALQLDSLLRFEEWVTIFHE